MFNYNGITNGLSFTKIISGLSKTLQIANQIIPLYSKVKPAIKNAQSAFKIFKEMNLNKNENLPKKIVEKTKIKKEEEIKDSPTFFL